LAYLKLIRAQNLILILIIQVIIKYALFHPFEIDITLTTLQFSMLVLATLCIAAAGYIINDIQDVDIDRINRPEKVIVGKKVSEKISYSLFIILNCIGVVLGFILSNSIGKPGFFALFIIISALLYLYATYLKSVIVLGNIIISVLVSMSLILVGLFDLLPTITPENQSTQSTFFSIVMDYALFAFIINFIREMVKDVQDVDGDKHGGITTLPIVIGRQRTIYIVFSLAVLLLFGIVYYMYSYLYYKQIAIIYFLFLIVAPLIYFCVRTWGATTKKDYRFLSQFLKIIMILGMGSLLLYQFILI
jgi:4-hydroxybenzoate polyprenyltransferase